MRLPTTRSPLVWIARCLLAAPTLGAAAAAGEPSCVCPPFRGTGGSLRAIAPDYPRLAQSPRPAFAPTATSGDVRLLVILAEFADVPSRIAPSRFVDHLFGPGPSLSDYYDEVSLGALSLDGHVHGWVALPSTEFYYSQGNGGVGTYPNNAQRMAEDAVTAAISSGVDLDDYDLDSNGLVDALLVVHSGQGLEWALPASGGSSNSTEPNANAIVSHKWVLHETDFGAGPNAVDYFTCPELQLVRIDLVPAWTDSIATIGVYCHEFGHMLGLPDYYDTNTGDSRVGVWDLMDYGTWNRDPLDLHAFGSLPGHFSGWSKMFLGWTTPIEVAPLPGEEIETIVTLPSASTGGRPAQLLANSGGVDWENGAPGRGEFFVVEARTREGYDAGLPGEGVLVYHVDEGRASNRAADFADGAGLLLLEPQDGNVSIGETGTAGETWPGGQTSFDAASSPSSRRHGGAESGVAIETFDVTTLGSGTARITTRVQNLESLLPVPFARPHPWRPASAARVELVLSTFTPATAPTRVGIHDLLGRRVRSITSGSIDATGRTATWDGRTDSGRPVASGVYFFRVEEPVASSASGRVVVLR